MKKIHFLYICACVCCTLPTTGLHTASAGSAIPTAHAPAQGRIGKTTNIPKFQKLPDLNITRIYHKKHLGKEGIWADIKNNGGPIPKNQFEQASMRFYIHYLKPKGYGENGYKLSYLENHGAGQLSKAGGSLSAEAPGNLTCRGKVQVKVEVDLPISGNGRIRESNEHNNVKTAIIRCQ